MDNRPIGVFDSGIGGLTVLTALQKKLPNESCLYLGDTARVPYGTRSSAAVVRYAINNARTLLERADIKLMVVACNTASAVSLEALKREIDIPIIGVIKPGARAATSVTRKGPILVLGTAGTIRSGAYEGALNDAGYDGVVKTQACPLFVPLVEEGWVSGEITEKIVATYLADIPPNLETLILGCTHYPLLRDAIASVLPAQVKIVDSGEATANEVADYLKAKNAFAENAPVGHSIFVTDDPAQVQNTMRHFLGAQLSHIPVELIDVKITPPSEISHD